MDILYVISQIGIVVFGATAIFLVARKDKWQRYGYLFGLIGQPFWFIAVIHGEQWGMFTLCLFYTYSWVIGFKNHFLKQK